MEKCYKKEEEEKLYKYWKLRFLLCLGSSSLRQEIKI